MENRFTAEEVKLILTGTDGDWVGYIQRHISDRVLHLEPYIAKFPRAAYWYARGVIRGPWPEGEPAIAQHPMAAYEYTKDIIGGRWPAGEATIKKDKMIAIWYANVLRSDKCGLK